jgi:hypothetical protein
MIHNSAHSHCEAGATSRPRRQYVVRVSDPKTPGDYTAIAAAGRPVAVLPHKCGSVEEWAARYPAGRMQ